MQSESLPLIVALTCISLIMPPQYSAQAKAIAMPLCNGGVVLIKRGSKPAPADPPGACHAACVTRRDDED